ARKHDLVVIQLTDPIETALPGLGIVPMLEKESGKTIWVNTSSGKFRNMLDKTHRKNTLALEDFCKRNDVNYVSVETGEDYVPKLVRLFRHRNQTNAQRAR
ncbi:MAG: hypothetical protein ACI8WP_001491, partial [Flavobacteriaceae bacterium]